MYSWYDRKKNSYTVSFYITMNNSDSFYMFWYFFVFFSPFHSYCASEAVPDIDALPFHQRAVAGPSAQKSWPSSGGNHYCHLQHGLRWLWCLLFSFHAGVPQWLSRCRHQPTSCSRTQLQAWTGMCCHCFSVIIFIVLWNWKILFY